MKPVILIDLSGTLHVEDEPTPGAVAALDRLRGSGLLFRFVTNTTKESSRRLLAKLRAIGFRIEPEEMFTSLTAAKKLIIKENLNPLMFLEDAGLEEFADCRSLIEGTHKNAVVIGLSPTHFNYDRMTEAFRILKDGGRFIAIHKGRYFERKDGLALGPGPFVAGLELASGVTAQLVGKPEPSFFRIALESLNADPKDAIMIGDDARDDVGGALSMGFLAGYLVKTGKYRPGDDYRVTGDTMLSEKVHVVNDFSTAVESILSRFA
ncbi:Haloacid dehalogenase-like hydrolase domain-containing protein 2 [Cladochytrium replicatum]|nr:Haloacid dehalogenase-like hydrolase domain-containing protein 2 [Cladochytrium replicatum]